MDQLHPTQKKRNAEARRAWDAAAVVPDPEVPCVNVAELGILRNVEIIEGKAVAYVTPTYTGCPAVLAIELAIEVALREAGFEPKIERVISPAWTTDWISDEGAREASRLWHRAAGCWVQLKACSIWRNHCGVSAMRKRKH